ncbi:MAG: glycosyltransferase family 2 protein [Candidatus Lernaella stagnicola]|nr:glycosyltransferase family 2 protein [Candidatus Lernaella stagnicola]
MQQPAVSIIVPFYNAEGTLGRCLDSIKRCDSENLEIIAVDDGSTDDSARLARERDVTLLTMERQSGAAAARNHAVTAAAGDILVFIDADVLVPPGLIAAMMDRFAYDSELDAIFGAYTIFPEADNFASVYKNLVHHFTHLTSKREAITFWCGCGAVRREAFQQIGGFDQSYTAASVEDIELGYRLHKNGATIRLDPSLRVCHAKKYSLSSLIRSDLFDRAIPWTKLMARENIFNLDLNLKIGNVVSGILIALFLPVALTTLWVLPVTLSAPFVLVVLVVYVMLNVRIWWYVFRVKGLVFSALFLIMISITYFYSVMGFGLGLWMYLSEKRKHPAAAGD